MTDPRPVADAASSSPPPGPSLRRSGLIRLIVAACLATLFGLGVTIAHLLWPSPLLFALFMTAGQGSFGIAMVLYLIVIISDLRRSRVL